MVAISIPWYLVQPLPEEARAPFVIGSFVLFGWVVIWAIRQRGRRE